MEVGNGYTQRGVATGLKVPCLFMITEVSIRCQKNPGGWYTPYTRVYPPPIHHWVHLNITRYDTRCYVNERLKAEYAVRFLIDTP